MALTYGVTPQGYVKKPSSVIRSEVDTDLQGILGASAGTEPDGTIPLASMAGQLKTMLVNGFSAQWDLQQSVVANLDPNQASGASQDVIGSLSGTIRDAESFSKVTATCTGTPLTLLQAGRVATVTTTGARFDTIADATIAAATAWSGTTTYVAGDRRKNGNNIYLCTVGGISAGAGGPTGTASPITDGAVTWIWIGAGTGFVDVVFQAESAGQIGALAGALSSIATPVSGWSNVYNALDAVVGALQESDAAYRARRNLELALAGNATVEAIRANILAVNQGSTDPSHAAPSACTVFYNDTDYVDTNGLPPHSVEIMVQGGTDQDIANAVWASVAAGTRTVGNQTTTVTDSQGNPQVVNWTRPTAVPIYVAGVVYYDGGQWPANSNTTVAQAALSALLTYAASPTIGVDVRSSPLAGAIMFGPSQTDASGNAVVPAIAGSAPVKGLLEVPTLLIDRSPAPSTTGPVSIGVREVATFQSVNIALTATTETP